MVRLYQMYWEGRDNRMLMERACDVGELKGGKRLGVQSKEIG